MQLYHLTVPWEGVQSTPLKSRYIVYTCSTKMNPHHLDGGSDAFGMVRWNIYMRPCVVMLVHFKV